MDNGRVRVLHHNLERAGTQHKCKYSKALGKCDCICKSSEATKALADTCSTKDWFVTPESIGWGTCPSMVSGTVALTGLYSGSCGKAGEKSCVQAARCCDQPGQQEQSGKVEWDCTDSTTGWKTHGWASCPDGSFLHGVQRVKATAYSVDAVKCCKPKKAPVIEPSLDKCYVLKVGWVGDDASFGKSTGWQFCRSGYAMAGLRRDRCLDLNCVSEARCCPLNLSGSSAVAV